MRRKTFDEFQAIDQQAQASNAELTMSELLVELRAFTAKFNAALFQAGFNCLELHRLSQTWRQCIVWVNLGRLPDAGAIEKPWARWSVANVLPVPTEFMAGQIGGNKYEFLETKRAQEREQLAKGYLGVITLIISGSADGLNRVLHNVTCIGFGTYSQSALKIEDNWEDTFKDTVERMCGRDPALRESNLPERMRGRGSAN